MPMRRPIKLPAIRPPRSPTTPMDGLPLEPNDLTMT
ncbi:unnamed protein product [Dibothriocephalus latus]|uniref:Uncharacterized protein n=1 Tax=Dibothriocephalus latus TaxID=60516 RepID=A0A3P6QAS2_DIBLA|nr:unnamed protein product [Dibothriocephalus latus]